MKLSYKITQDIKIAINHATLDAFLSIPENTKSIVVFVHGSGSSRYSERNQFVAHALNNAEISTLLIDLLTAEEEIIDSHSRHLRFDIDLLANRVLQITQWVMHQPSTHSLPISYFGASTGAAAALKAAAAQGDSIKSVVSRGGRPDLAGESLLHVKSPTLLIVGGGDRDVLELNESALRLIPAKKDLKIVPGATHLFEESGALEQVASLATAWFLDNG